jgi:hypothetical protein
VRFLGVDLQDRSHIAPIDEFQHPDYLILIIRTDEFASVEERPVIAPDLIERFTIMWI